MHVQRFRRSACAPPQRRCERIHASARRRRALAYAWAPACASREESLPGEALGGHCGLCASALLPTLTQTAGNGVYLRMNVGMEWNLTSHAHLVPVCIGGALENEMAASEGIRERELNLAHLGLVGIARALEDDSLQVESRLPRHNRLELAEGARADVAAELPRRPVHLVVLLERAREVGDGRHAQRRRIHAE
eukprot:4261666-Pleurochrysis_carterae.AAC.1